MALKFQMQQEEPADLDVTSFMNLMIVLVPVLLMSMTFTQISVHEIKLPDLNQAVQSSQEKPSQLEVVITPKKIDVFYPANRLIQTVDRVKTDDGENYDFKKLSLVMREVKKQLSDKQDILIFSDKKVDYQTLVSTMDAVKSYKAVVAANLVEVELFPEVSLADMSVR